MSRIAAARLRPALLAALLAVLACGGEPPRLATPAGGFAFGVWGDAPYAGDELIRVERGEVLLIHGDDHTLVVDEPWAGRLERGALRRLEVYGAPEVGWIEVVVDPQGEPLFRFEPRLQRRGLWYPGRVLGITRSPIWEEAG